MEYTSVFGDPLTVWFGWDPMVILNTNRVVREALVEKAADFSNRIPPKIGKYNEHPNTRGPQTFLCSSVSLKHFTSDSTRTKGSHNIIFEDYNATHKVLRKVCLTAVR